VFWCWVSAELYEEQNFIGVIAVAKACYQALLQSSTEQWKLYFSKGTAAVYWCWDTAELYEEQTFIGELHWHRPAVTLFCRAELSSGDRILPKAVLQCFGVGSLLSCMKSKTS